MRKSLQLRLIELDTGVEAELKTKIGELRITRSNYQNKNLKLNAQTKYQQRT